MRAPYSRTLFDLLCEQAERYPDRVAVVAEGIGHTYGELAAMAGRVASALKDFSVFDATPRAVNFLRSSVKPRHNATAPAAVEQGTAIVAYSPAVTAASLILTLEMVFDSFDEVLFAKVGEALKSLAGIPVFAPAQGVVRPRAFWRAGVRLGHRSAGAGSGCAFARRLAVAYVSSLEARRSYRPGWP